MAGWLSLVCALKTIEDSLAHRSSGRSSCVNRIPACEEVGGDQSVMGPQCQASIHEAVRAGDAEGEAMWEDALSDAQEALDVASRGMVYSVYSV